MIWFCSGICQNQKLCQSTAVLVWLGWNFLYIPWVKSKHFLWLADNAHLVVRYSEKIFILKTYSNLSTTYFDMKKSSVDHHEGLEDHGIYFWSFVRRSNFIRRSVTDRKLIFSSNWQSFLQFLDSSNFEFHYIFLYAFDIFKRNFQSVHSTIVGEIFHY